MKTEFAASLQAFEYQSSLPRTKPIILPCSRYPCTLDCRKNLVLYLVGMRGDGAKVPDRDGLWVLCGWVLLSGCEVDLCRMGEVFGVIERLDESKLMIRC